MDISLCHKDAILGEIQLIIFFDTPIYIYIALLMVDSLHHESFTIDSFKLSLLCSHSHFQAHASPSLLYMNISLFHKDSMGEIQLSILFDAHKIYIAFLMVDSLQHESLTIDSF